LTKLLYYPDTLFRNPTNRIQPLSGQTLTLTPAGSGYCKRAGIEPHFMPLTVPIQLLLPGQHQ